MADNKKELERDELHKAIWSIADDLRGSVDGWDFKSYVLSTMFYRFISENLTAYVNAGEHEAGNTSFDYAEMSDKEAEEARNGNLFFGTSIATCIMVLKKNKKDSNILFIDASNEFLKVTNNNKLTEENITHIVDAFTKRKDSEYFTKLASYEEVQEQGYNLSVSTYVEQKDTGEKIDIVKLNAEIKEIVAREQVLRDEIDKIIAEIEAGDTNE